MDTWQLMQDVVELGVCAAMTRASDTVADGR